MVQRAAGAYLASRRALGRQVAVRFPCTSAGCRGTRVRRCGAACRRHENAMVARENDMLRCNMPRSIVRPQRHETAPRRDMPPCTARLFPAFTEPMNPVHGFPQNCGPDDSNATTVRAVHDRVGSLPMPYMRTTVQK
ncbi:hypothetical protein CBM2637_A140048 [Cupriavidus taiwanensis]|nr:hypothetical protein CBM2637_A140048 [Cupriavidus taiwanensis]